MNKKLINFVVTVIIALLLSQFLPWWCVMIAGFVSALLFSLKKAAVFYIPFLAIFCFWTVYAFILSSSNDFILAKKIAVLLPLGGNPYLLIAVTGLVGGLAAGIAAVFGKQLSTLVRN
jgi:FtsH-binding integral membrane protein